VTLHVYICCLIFTCILTITILLVVLSVIKGMNSEMCDILTSEYSIYLTRDGRVSLAGLNEKNIEYVANAIHSVTAGKSITTK